MRGITPRLTHTLSWYVAQSSTGNIFVPTMYTCTSIVQQILLLITTHNITKLNITKEEILVNLGFLGPCMFTHSNESTN